MSDTAVVLSSSLEELMELGLYTGMGDIWIAAMIKEETADTPPEYDKPVIAAEGVEFGITPNYAEGKQSASDRTIREVRIPTSYTVRMGYPRMLASVRSYILAHTRDAKGGEVLGDQTPPYVAVGYAAHRDDGTVHMRWLYKVRWTERTVEDKTAEDGSITYGIPVLEGTAVRLNCKVTPEGGKPFRPLRYDADTADETVLWTEEEFFAAVPWYAAEAEAAATEPAQTEEPAQTGEA